MRLVKVLIANVLAILVSSFLLSGFSISGSWAGYLIAGIVLAVLNLLLKPILKLISGPIILITLGLFTLVINGFILWLASAIIPGYISIEGVFTLIGASIIITIFNLIITRKS
ncbi:MAG: membrane protein of unknown function [Parcubacteria group bacterium Licking1014_17]|nr:MAG: membrane protein of unknown function [Parcubacteria group bacterium Licking1014_17]